MSRSRPKPAKRAKPARSKPAKRAKSVKRARSIERTRPTNTKRAPAKRAPAKRAPGKRAPAKRAPAKRAHPPKRTTRATSQWERFVASHGVVLATARGSVPSIAEQVVGEPIVGSWWSHPKAKAIFDALSTLDDCEDIRCFKLIDGKITFVHRTRWPALVKLVASGVLPAQRAEAIHQEHMPTGEHRNVVLAFPDWVPEDVIRASEQLSVDDARTMLGV